MVGWSGAVPVDGSRAAVLRLGWPVRVIEAPPSNLKITTPFDLTIAEAVLAARVQGGRIN